MRAGFAKLLTECFAGLPIPTMMFFKDGKHVDTLVGANPGVLEQKVMQHLA